MARRTFLLLWSLALVAGTLALAPPSLAQSVDAKQQQARQLEARIREQGRRLSIAGEDFNEARLERERLQARSGEAKQLVVDAEQRWAGYRGQLNRRARLLYMHPGAAIEAFFGARTLGEVARARVYGEEVLITDTELVARAERARREVMERARALDSLRRASERKESELAARRSQVQRELATQRGLLGSVRGEIAELVAAERARQAAAEAAAAASTQSPAAAPAPAAAARPAARPEVKAEEPTAAPPPVRSSASKALETARAQIGKPYEWGASGPDSFDCSGLTMYAWASAGVSLPHSSRAQYASLPKVSRSQLQPGDLVFFGSPIHHVGIYEGGGMMINAPETGEFVRRNAIGRSDYVGAARP